MKRITVVFLVAVFAVLVMFLSPAQANKKAERDKIVREYLEAAKAIAEKTKDSEALKIYTFLKNNYILGTPHQKGVRYLDDAKTKTWVVIVPLLESDKKVGKRWKNILESENSGANFFPDARMIVLKKTNNFSSIWKGLFLLHEGKHARDFITEPYDWENHKVYCYKEAETHDFQNRIMSGLGGSKYKELLNKEMIRIENFVKSSGKNFDDVVVRIISYPELSNAFGLKNFKSVFEKNAAETGFWVHAYFGLIETRLQQQQGSVDYKARFLYREYMEAGILPK